VHGGLDAGDADAGCDEPRAEQEHRAASCHADEWGGEHGGACGQDEREASIRANGT
jgi:hypothetical protein